MEFQLWLEDLQLWITSLNNRWLIILAILSLFAIKSLIGILPMAPLFVISGMVFPVTAAVLINISGIIVLMSLKYTVGLKFGGGRTKKILKKYPSINKVFESGGEGNPWLLLFFRIVPNFPVNTVSRLYGNMNFPYEKYIFISLLGFSPRLISYSVIGNNVFDPFSAGFLAPIIVLLLISGLSMLVLNAVISHIIRASNNIKTQ